MGIPKVWLITFVSVCTSAQYQPNWDSIDSRSLPAWYDQSKFGVFIHWGLYSVPSFEPNSEWFWWRWKGSDPSPDVDKFMKDIYKPYFTYSDFASSFRAEFFDPYEWTDILQASGAKYVVLTSKHHDGFTNWPSKYSWNWNSDIGPRRDLVGELASALRNETDIRFGLYYSLYEWFNPLYLEDKANRFRTNEYCMQLLWPELLELVNKYKPDVLWSDGDTQAYDSYWNSTEILAWLYNSSPTKDTIVTNDRWGYGTRCRHGGFYTCKDEHKPMILRRHKWENYVSIDKASSGFRRTASLTDYRNMDELIELLASTVSCNGNLIINIGPTAEGDIIPIYEERLRSMGEWLKVNGEAIFETRPWRAQNDTVAKGIWYTNKTTGIYAIVLDWPANNKLFLGAPIPSSQSSLFMLGYNQPLKWSGYAGKPGIHVTMPQLNPATMPCQWAWVIKMTMVQ
nr:alpha-L-fucosidase-like [Lytechinus pictus]